MTLKCVFGTLCLRLSSQHGYQCLPRHNVAVHSANQWTQQFRIGFDFCCERGRRTNFCCGELCEQQKFQDSQPNQSEIIRCFKRHNTTYQPIRSPQQIPHISRRKSTERGNTLLAFWFPLDSHDRVVCLCVRREEPHDFEP